MAFVTLNYFSEALMMQTEVYVIIPQKSNSGEIGNGSSDASGERDYKCLYLLHGLSDDHTIWMRRTSIERYATKYGICVVMPCGARSFYTDMKYGLNYYTFIARELPAKIREFFRVSDKREDNFVAGLSMGGYGALKIALRESDSFCAGAGLSSAIDMKGRSKNPILTPIFGENGEVPDDDDLFKLVEKCAKKGNKPKIFLGVGLEDVLYGESQMMKKALLENNFDLTYRESHGAHSWEFWDEYIQIVLEWLFESK